MKLPPLIFLIGPPNCGKTTLANLLCEQSAYRAHCSFDEPIREATLQTFFPDQMQMGIHLREEAVLKQPLPFTNLTIGDRMIALRKLIDSISPTLAADTPKTPLSYIRRRYKTFTF